jgi:tyrosine-protein phosphatase non-receptor type 23
MQNNQGTPTQNTQAVVSPNNQIPPVQVAPKPAIKSENIDLLSDIDFSIPSSTINNIPLLTPISITAKKDEVKESPKKVPDPIPAVTQSQVKLNDDLADLDFSSLTMTMISPQVVQPKVEEPKKFEDPFDDVNVLKQFHKEVEGLEKYMETLTVKTMNGITPLANKWKELQDLLVKDESSRSISIAKLFPDKNRFADFLPYDHGRVLLPTSTDNYINAAMIRDCGPVPFIMAQIPMENTMNDYWEMVWSQKSNVLVCLYSNSEVIYFLSI